MAIAFVQKATAVGSNTLSAITATISSTTGNLLVACIQHQGGSMTSVTDTAGNTWVKGSSTFDNSATSQRRNSIWYCLNAAHVTTVTATAGGTVVRLFVYEYSGAGSLRGAVSQAQSTTTTGSAGPVINATTGDLVIGITSYNEATLNTRLESLNAGYTERDSFNNGAQPRMSSAESIRGSSGNTSPTWTFTAGTHAESTIAFAPANIAPTAGAGSDMTNKEPGIPINITGTDSDSDGTISSRLWSVSPTTGVTLSNQTTATVTATFPPKLTDQTYTMTYTVTDNGGLTGNDTMTVQVLAVTTRAVVGGVEVPVIWYVA